MSLSGKITDEEYHDFAHLNIVGTVGSIESASPIFIQDITDIMTQ